MPLVCRHTRKIMAADLWQNNHKKPKRKRKKSLLERLEQLVRELRVSGSQNLRLLGLGRDQMIKGRETMPLGGQSAFALDVPKQLPQAKKEGSRQSRASVSTDTQKGQIP